MDLAVEKRESFGKSTKHLRGKGLIPGELYGRGIENLHVAVDAKVFEKVFHEAGENTVINIVLGNEKRPVLVHDIKRDYLTGKIDHIDFYQVRMDEKIRAHIPIEFVGEAPAVKEQGGFLNKTIIEIEVEALPGDLPHSLALDLSSLTELNQSLYTKDIKIPKDVKVILDADAVLATVTPPIEEEKETGPVDVSAVKVESEEKKAERDAEKAEGATGEAA